MTSPILQAAVDCIGPLFPAPHTKKEFNTNPAIKPLSIDFDSIPNELKSWNHWIGWSDMPWRDDKKGKEPFYFGTPFSYTRNPYEPNTLIVIQGEFGLYNAKPNDPQTWMSFDGARDYFFGSTYARERRRKNCRDAYYGLGFLLTNTPYIGVDLDCCRDPATGKIESWALEIIHLLQSYTEVSPSGTGVKIWGRGNSPGKHTKNSTGTVEFYGNVVRYFTTTGHALFGYGIRNVQSEIDDVYARVMADRITADEQAKTRPAHYVAAPSADSFSASPRVANLSDQDLIDRASNARNGAAFDTLWRGDWSAHPSRSEADQALASHLAFWCGPDAGRIESLMRQSGLVREKWDDRPNYLPNTINKAVRGCQSFYGDGFDTEFDDLAEFINDLNFSDCSNPAPISPTRTLTEKTAELDNMAAALAAGATADAARAAEIEAERAKNEQRREKAIIACPRARRANNAKDDKRRILLIVEYGCGRWDCRACGALLREKWFDNITMRLTHATQDERTLYAGTVASEDWTRFYDRLRRYGTQQLGRSPNFFRAIDDEDGDGYFVVCEIDPGPRANFTPISQDNALTALMLRIDAPVEGKRIISSKRWAPPHPPRKKSTFTRLGSVLGAMPPIENLQEIANHHQMRRREIEVHPQLRPHTRRMMLFVCRKGFTKAEETFAWLDLNEGELTSHCLDDLASEKPPQRITTPFQDEWG